MVSWILMITSIYRILDADWLWCLVAMVVTTESKVIINGKFYATGPIYFFFFFTYCVITCILPLVSLVATCTNAFNDELGVLIHWGFSHVVSFHNNQSRCVYTIGSLH